MIVGKRKNLVFIKVSIVCRMYSVRDDDDYLNHENLDAVSVIISLDKVLVDDFIILTNQIYNRIVIRAAISAYLEEI